MLANVTSPGNGRVMYKLDGTPGAICMLDSLNGIQHPLAKVACRELGYVDGVLLLEEHYRTWNRTKYRLPRYPDRHAETYLVSVKCVGNESKVRECSYELLNGTDKASPDTCDSRSYRTCAYQRY